MEMKEKSGKKRYELLDSIRGLVLISMILYHVCWDLVYLFGQNFSWYQGTGAYLWQQSICQTFILLSGFCWSLGKKPAKRGLIVFLGGAVISVITILFLPRDRVVFGVLTLIGSCMLLMIPLQKVLKKIPSATGLAVSILLFVMTKKINYGYLGLKDLFEFHLPAGLYKGPVMTFLGFPSPDFYSTDYFSLFPWLFLFLSGYFLYGMLSKAGSGKFLDKYFVRGISPLSFLGKHSLLIYMLHQPVIYGILLLAYKA